MKMKYSLPYLKPTIKDRVHDEINTSSKCCGVVKERETIFLFIFLRSLGQEIELLCTLVYLVISFL